jgi:hypothetical protein
MKERIPRKLKKGARSLLYHGDTKWKRKASNLIQKEVKGFALGFVGNGVQLFEPGGIVSDKPVSNRGEYVVTNEQRQRLEAMLKSEPDQEVVHVSINLDDLTMAEKRKILRR